MNCPHLFDVAPYALGTLDPEERAGVASHLAACQDCQAVLDSVAGLPGLLARVEPDAVEPDEAEPDEAMFQRLLARSADVPDAPTDALADAPADTPRAPRRGRPRRRLVLAAAAVVALAAGGGWALHEAAQDDGTQVVASSSGPVHATVWVTGKPSGTAVRLQLSGVEAEQNCRLVAVDRTGRRTVAATWEAGYSGTATFEGSVPVPKDQLTWLRVETDTRTLVTFPLS